MKTYEQFRRELMTKLDEGLLNGPVSFGKIEELAAKEYAKQWVEEAVFWSAKQSEYGLPIINEALPRLQKRIDAQ